VSEWKPQPAAPAQPLKREAQGQTAQVRFRASLQTERPTSLIPSSLDCCTNAEEVGYVAVTLRADIMWKIECFVSETQVS
jgi:hypothetical protein